MKFLARKLSAYLLTAVVVLFSANFVSMAEEAQVSAPTGGSSEANVLLQSFEKELSLSKTNYQQVINKVADSEMRFEIAHRQSVTLDGEIALLDQEIRTRTARLVDVLKNIVAKENMISQIYEQIEKQDILIADQKEQLKDYLTLLYQEQKSLLTTDQNGEIDAVKLLLADESVGDNLRDMKYLDVLSEAGKQMLERLDGLHREQDGLKERIKRERSRLQDFQTEMSKEKDDLELQKQAKERLMDVTKGQESVFQEIYSQSLAEQDAVLSDLKQLDDVVRQIQDDVANGRSYGKEHYMSLLGASSQNFVDFYRANLNGEAHFAWPADPNFKGISAFFRDPSYRAAFGVNHQAIDIPEYQGTAVRAAESGVVYAAKDNGYGYNYIILAHAGGFRTVYGHVSQLLVREGQVVSKGTVIALSGGMPGTKGAGYMTTGPHLHFEVLLNGQHVDPLDYLPLSILDAVTVENWPEKYLKAWGLSGKVERLDN